MKIKVSLISDDKSSSRALGIALANRAENICCVTSEAEADIGILFTDSYSGDAWRVVRDKLNFPIILISPTPLSGESLLIEKPFKYTELLNLLLKVMDELPKDNTAQGSEHVVVPVEKELSEQVREEVSSETLEKTAKQMMVEEIAQAAEDAVRQVKKDGNVITSIEKPPVFKHQSKPEKKPTKTRSINTVQISNKRIRFEPLNYLVGYLAEVITEKHINDIKVFEWDNMWLLVNEKQKTVKASMRKRLLPHLTVIPINEIPTRNLSASEEMEFALKAKLSLSVEDLLWLITPFVAGQALPEGFNQNRKYALNAWPNFTQHHWEPVFLAVASYWVDKSASVDELTTLFNLPLKKLAPFVTSCYLSGFLDTSNSDIENDAVRVKSKNNVGMKHVFRKMLTKLRHAK